MAGIKYFLDNRMFDRAALADGLDLDKTSLNV